MHGNELVCSTSVDWIGMPWTSRAVGLAARAAAAVAVPGADR